MTKTWKFSKGQPQWGLSFNLKLEDGSYPFEKQELLSRTDKNKESYDILVCKINGRKFMLPYKATELEEGIEYPSVGNATIKGGLLADISASE